MRRTMAAIGTATFFVLAPGVVAGGVPWLLTRWQVREPLPYWLPARVIGLALVTIGLAVLASSFVRFVTEGIGTPAPIAPTEHLVVGGLYRHVRNPMYVAVLAIVVGQALVLGQPALLLYAAALWVAFAGFVHWYEEPVLARRYGSRYDAYRHHVPAWLPRWRPWREQGSP